MKTLIHIVVLSLFCCINIIAQSKKAEIILIDKNVEAKKLIEESFSYQDTLQLLDRVNIKIKTLQKQGYLLANLSTVDVRNDSLIYMRIYAGKQFNWAALSKGNLPEVLISKVSFKEKFYRNTNFKPDKMALLFNRLLKLSQNSGYPFAWASLDSVSIQDNHIKATVHYEPGPLITFDSIAINENLPVKKAWLQAYLSIVPGQPFDQKLVDQISDKIENLSFLRIESTPVVTFQNEKACVLLQLKKEQSNKIDGIIGFLPNAKSDGAILITGQFDMEIKNLFQSGKSVGVHWQSLKPKSQLLDINYLHRNLFHSALHFKSSFYLLKEDTTFINRKGNLALHYQPNLHDLSFFTRFESSRILSDDLVETLQVGNLSDFNITYYGLTHHYTNLSKDKVPKGFSTYLELAVGNKKLRNNNSLPDELLEKINKRTTQYFFHGQVSRLQPLSKTIGLLIKTSGGKLINDQLFLNELFRVGGLQSLRGFNENFFFASEYLIGTAELRVHYNQSSYFFLFYDQSYLYYRLFENKFEDYPLGIGAGLSLNTKNGTIKLAYALGKSNEQPLSLSLSKFHFGYVAKF